MDLNQRITAFSNLGQFLKDYLSDAPKSDLALQDFKTLTEEFTAVIETSHRQNAWFTPEYIKMALLGDM